MASETLTIIDNRTGRQYEIPIKNGAVKATDLFQIRITEDEGIVSYDPGFMNTASCQSKITYIDGDRGILRYRGYPIEQLAEKSNFLEICYLLLNGDLPNAKQREEFELGVMRHTMLHEQIRQFYNGFRRDAHPMAVMCGVVGALSAFYHDSLDIHDPEQRTISAFRLIAKVPTIAAWAHKYNVGQPFMYPRNDLSYAENFLYMFHAVPAEAYKVNPVLSRAMDLIMILHADHEQNASTSTVRLAGSTGANPFACIAAGIASLWGPAHGGANEAVLNMLTEIGHKSAIKPFLDNVKDKNSHARLMGFGHRVYKNYDPRAKIMQRMCHAVLAETGHGDDPMLKVALELEKIALHDQYFIDRKLYPNVDFYSGIIYRALGFPTNMFTVLFAIGRLPGWIAHWKEMMEDGTTKIGRPRQIYTGPTERAYVPLEKRAK